VCHPSLEFFGRNVATEKKKVEEEVKYKKIKVPV
jgi:hypothetical protein